MGLPSDARYTGAGPRLAEKRALERCPRLPRRGGGTGMTLLQAVRKWLWLNHGHQGQYGDDGEMQCAACLRYGVVDYKRDALERLLGAAGKAISAELTLLR